MLNFTCSVDEGFTKLKIFWTARREMVGKNKAFFWNKQECKSS